MINRILVILSFILFASSFSSIAHADTKLNSFMQAQYHTTIASHDICFDTDGDDTCDEDGKSK